MKLTTTITSVTTDTELGLLRWLLEKVRGGK